MMLKVGWQEQQVLSDSEGDEGSLDFNVVHSASDDIKQKTR